MNPKITKLYLEAVISRPRSILRHGEIIVPTAPINLDSAARAAIENEHDLEAFVNSGADIVFEQIGWEREPLLCFYWQSFGPMVCETHVDLLHIDQDRALACITQDSLPRWQAFAIVKNPDDEAVVSALFRALLKNNGAAFGLQLFGSLPTNTHNMVEHLISKKSVRQAYWAWSRWAERALQFDWLGLFEETSARSRSPILYPLELLRKRADEAGGNPTAWLEARRRENSRLDPKIKRIIFDGYFRLSYGLY